MKSEIDKMVVEALERFAQCQDLHSIEQMRVLYLGKKSPLKQLSSQIKNVSKEDKPQVGQWLNQAKQQITTCLNDCKSALQKEADAKLLESTDYTLPARHLNLGNQHPINLMNHRAISILRKMGFSLAEGPEIETQFHCFDALNTPPDHPARNDSDTFYFDSGKLLRTQNSSVQIRTMEMQSLPVKIIASGSAYRRDTIDATHLSVFNQLEGLSVSNEVQLSDLKGTLSQFFQTLFGEKTQIRFRPHFFPFTEPSFEIDIKLNVAGEPSKWIEVAGCGLVDPAVFEAVNQSRGDLAYNPEICSGFAFGMGIDRLAMIQWGISDIRLLIENDVRFLSQFSPLN